MAGRLVLSPSTVRTHISNIFAKLGAANRAEAAALAIKHRLIAE
jgi:DNA-binding NarL/FixJ family response regulator